MLEETGLGTQPVMWMSQATWNPGPPDLPAVPSHTLCLFYEVQKLYVDHILMYVIFVPEKHIPLPVHENHKLEASLVNVLVYIVVLLMAQGVSETSNL